jgi:predicted cupin superfamily sugar epimerase
MDADRLIAELRLQPHPEGGWYREVFRSPATVPTPRGARAALTSIYFLLEARQVSRWHVVDSDEAWHYAHGAPLELLTYQPATRELRRRVLGPPGDDCEPTAVVPAGVWQAACSLGAGTLVACDVAPGFDFADFRFVATLADHETHIARLPADCARFL